ncbi:translation initiation factor IF-2-like [Rhinolophus ferrumequinum]|uniref:translation initiation factor IF-2-like n=1 Tax=Rhinolophus ferrumequinum TaxID=59479 RepID=UPI00140F9C1A|nr:translation initiation factor IF-2-like [Rhinolophus ferrumequinum]
MEHLGDCKERGKGKPGLSESAELRGCPLSERVQNSAAPPHESPGSGRRAPPLRRAASRLLDSCSPANADRLRGARPSPLRDCGPELQKGGLCLSHRGLRPRLATPLAKQPSPERRRDVSGGHRGQRATESFLSVAPGAGRRRRPETPRGQARQDAAPHPVLPPHSSVPCDAHRAPGPGPALALRWSGGQGGREPWFLNGKRELFLRLPAVRAPATSGLCVPSAAGVHPGLEFWERRTERASPRMASPLWAASPGGPHGSSPPKFVCPVRKAFPLQSTKAKRPGRALKSPGLGRGWPEAREHGGGAGLRTEKVARPG